MGRWSDIKHDIGTGRGHGARRAEAGIREGIKDFLGVGPSSGRRRFIQQVPGVRYGTQEEGGPRITGQSPRRLVTKITAGEQIYKSKKKKLGSVRRRSRTEAGIIRKKHIDPETGEVVRKEKKKVWSAAEAGNRSWIGEDYGEWFRLKYPDYNPYTSEGAQGDYYRGLLGKKGAKRAGEKWASQQADSRNREAVYNAALGLMSGEDMGQVLSDFIKPNVGT